MLVRTGLLAALATVLAFSGADVGAFDGNTDKSRFFKPRAALSISRQQLTPALLGSIPDRGWRAALEDAGIYLTRSTEEGHAYRLGIAGQDMELPVVLPGSRDRARLAKADGEALLRFSREWDAGAWDALETVDVQRLRVAMGDAEADVGGRVSFDEDGLANGHLNVDLREWEAMLDVLGATEPDMRKRAAAVLSPLADGNRVSVRLSLSGGQVRLGPIPLGRIPPIGPEDAARANK